MAAFKLVLIRPSHYDDGYVIQWWRSGIPSNTLAVLYGLARDCAGRSMLGDGVKLDIAALDETSTRIDREGIARGQPGGNRLEAGEARARNILRHREARALRRGRVLRLRRAGKEPGGDRRREKGGAASPSEAQARRAVERAGKGGSWKPRSALARFC